MATVSPVLHNFPDVLDFNTPETIAPLFDMSEIADGITCKVLPEARSIYLSGRMNDTDFSLTVDLSGANGHTKPWQVVTAAKLFWYCYPQMYARFNVGVAPRDVILLIEDFDYEIACAWENKVHIHDRWLEQCPTDFDCLTHEFAHTVQGDWEDEWMPANGDDTYMVERFAVCSTIPAGSCRPSRMRIPPLIRFASGRGWTTPIPPPSVTSSVR